MPDPDEIKVIRVTNTPSVIGSYLCAETCRVDPSGNDSTGVLGNMLKPFETVQGAITALEAVAPFNRPMILLPTDYTPGNDITTSLPTIVFQGMNEDVSIENLILTNDGPLLYFNNCTSGDITAAASGGLFLKYDLSGEILGAISNSAGSINITCSGGGLVGATLSCPGFDINLFGVNWAREEQFCYIDSAGSDVVATQCVIADVLAAGSLTLNDSRLKANTSGVVPTYNNLLLTGP